jgi:hypothetical protein
MQVVADRAAGVAASAKEHASTVASSAADEARSVASEAATEARNVVADTRQQLRAQADEQAAKVAALFGDIGGQLRTMADAGQSGLAKDAVATVADQAQQLSRHLGDGGLDRTLEDARRFARNRPGTFLAGAAVAGFVVTRLLKAADTDGLTQAATAGHESHNGGHNDDAPLAASPTIAAGIDPQPRPLTAPAAGSTLPPLTVPEGPR